MPSKKKKIAVLVSGSGTNLQAIIDAVKSGILANTEISIVISSKKDAFALKRAEMAEIENIFLTPADFSDNNEFDKKLIEIISNYSVDLIVLAGYMRILTNEFINSFPNKIINIHPALLPDFGGKGMYGHKVHKAVLKSKVKESGCTVHYVIPEVDAGPIILQKTVAVLENDTVDSLSKRILSEEHKLLIEAIKKVLMDSHHCVI
ncbi:MAG: phosphoribosylglycinamide formyltransferase [Candidatus Melainabacteria bacterium RIFCSPHIGHO2_02_FULL_34_12]|nr:MAG: phosphoribosylglycinamide formyltransferase [Candidatus Melainabacteria bacterium RIFCSPHIGHO2_02_FULL_34_12]